MFINFRLQQQVERSIVYLQERTLKSHQREYPNPTHFQKIASDVVSIQKITEILPAQSIQFTTRPETYLYTSGNYNLWATATIENIS